METVSTDLHYLELTELAARISWARLLKRVFAIDIEHCPTAAAP